MAQDENDPQVQNAIQAIRAHQARAGATAEEPAAGWHLGGVSAARLALEGVAVFAVAFISGLGLGVLYQVLAGP